VISCPLLINLICVALIQQWKKWVPLQRKFHARLIHSAVSDEFPKNKIEQKINFSSISRSGYFSGNYDDRLDYHHGLRRWECSIWRGPLISVLREVESVLNVKKSFLKVYLVFFLSNSSVLISFYNSTSYVCDIKSGVVSFQGGNICGLIVPSSVESRIIELLFKHCKFVMLRIGEFIIPIW
jgi:hypothetical protein